MLIGLKWPTVNNDMTVHRESRRMVSEAPRDRDRHPSILAPTSPAWASPGPAAVADIALSLRRITADLSLVSAAPALEHSFKPSCRRQGHSAGWEENVTLGDFWKWICYCDTREASFRHVVLKHDSQRTESCFDEFCFVYCNTILTRELYKYYFN